MSGKLPYNPPSINIDMAKKTETVSQTELQILDQLWNESPKTIRQLCETIYKDASNSHYSTIQSLLDRLESKGWVSRDRSGFKHTFRPTKDRSVFVGQQIQEVANSVCGGSISQLLGQLANSKALSAKERRELRKLIDGDK